jgi:hypothetical protein
VTIKGTYKNPTEKPCWTFCASCNRCQDKGRYSKCNGCSGRYDPEGIIDADIDDYCDCKNGNLRWKTKQGRLIMTRFKSNPFKGTVKYEKKSEDERDWDSYVADMREKMDDPKWNPISIVDEY